MSEAPSSGSHRWSHLARYGLLGTGLVAAPPPAGAAPCRDITETAVTVVIGVDVSPKTSLFGGVEVRHCVHEATDVMARVELGAGPARVTVGGRTRPMADPNNYSDATDVDYLGLEAGFALDVAQRFGAHLAATYGINVAYAGIQGLFPLSGPARDTRVSLVGGIAPWHQEPESVPGRPLRAGERALLPDLATALPRLRSAEERAAQAYFTRAARLEASSVWTFLRLAAELVAVGAPAHLIAAALDAADDEVRHAELCAAAAGGVALTPLAIAAAQPRFTTRSPRALARLAVEAWLEGCLNEGAAAEEARVGAAGATDRDRAAMLSTIAHDEARHAALSWAVLAWLFEIAPDVTATALAALPPPAPYTADSDDDPALARLGIPDRRVSAHARRHVERTALARLAAL